MGPALNRSLKTAVDQQAGGRRGCRDDMENPARELRQVSRAEVFFPQLNQIHPAVRPQGSLAKKKGLALRVFFPGE